MNPFFNKSRKSRRSSARRRMRSLGFESMEGRQLMTVLPILATTTGVPVFAPPPSGPMAEGSIIFDASTGAVTIDASQTHDDTVNIYINHRAGNGAGDLPDLLTISLANINAPQVAAFDPTTVAKIVFQGHGGNDFVDNRTGVVLVAYGGTANDTFLGGTADDLLIGGGGLNYLDGRGGDDLLFGGSGTNVMFGDDGNDSLYGGSGPNYLFGGNGADYLYAGTGANVLYGGAGIDQLKSKSSLDKLYADYGPTVAVIERSYQGFDFFDRNLKDPMVRSMARYEYFRDAALSRGDMLDIYHEIETDGVASAIPYDGTVSAAEFSDLKMLTSTKLNIDAATRFLANQIANGNRANANYQQTALGNLAAGQSGDHLTKLVDKWFEGGDLPVAQDSDLSTLRYEQVSGSLFVNGAAYDDVDQGGTRYGPSDCYLLAALGEVAKRAPSDIYSMFTDNGDGTWTVRFFRNGVANYVTVNNELPVYGYGSSGTAWGAGFGSSTDAYGMTFANNYDNPNNELWVALAEKAYAQLNESGWIGQDGTNNYKGIDLGNPYIVFSQITGKSATYHSISTASALINAINAGQAITLDSKAKPSDSAVTPSHAYIVIGYNAVTKVFQLFNPHGYINSDSPTRGYQSPLVEASWDAIVANFGYWEGGLV